MRCGFDLSLFRVVSCRSTVAGLLALLLLGVPAEVSRGAEAEGAEDFARRVLALAGVEGGLVVHLGCGAGEKTAALASGRSFLVQGLDRDAANVDTARDLAARKNLRGKVTFAQLRGTQLPYADCVVNLLVAEDLGDVPMAEVTRVLAPRGVACVKTGQAWEKTARPVPEEIDDWTHFLYDPTNNAVADDRRVGPPHHVQWTAGPRWGRSHDHLASMSAAVSAGGRLFYIIDEGPVASVKQPSEWRLVARDAFSGVLLWKKEIAPWEDQLRPFRSGPAELARRLVVVGDRVYVTLGYGKPVAALEAATGEVLRTFEGTDNTHEILLADGKLYVVTCDPLEEETGTTGRIVRRLGLWRGAYARFVTSYPPKRLACLDAQSGKLLWEKDDADTKDLFALTLAVRDGRAFFENTTHVVALDAGSGKLLWKAERAVPLRRYAWSTPTLVVADGVVLSADRKPEDNLDTENGDKAELEWLVTSNHLLTSGVMVAYSAETGEKLWTAESHEGFNFPADVFVIDGKVYSGILAWARQPGITKVLDLHTGKVVGNRPPDQECYTIGFGHARCYRNKATTNYILHGRSGVELLDLESTRITADHWIRGTCQYGILPANGLIYVPPHSCACYITVKLNSFNALAPKRAASDESRSASGKKLPRLVKGAAYGEDSQPRRERAGAKDDWPTYRHDAARSGATECELGPSLCPAWKTELEGPLTALVVAEGKVFVAQKEAHTVHALSAKDGSPQWRFAAGGRVDSPPTVCEGNAYFGSADGWIYCLRAADGKLVWRFLAAPQDRQVVSYEQLESVWPLHGSVLVMRGDESAAPVVCAVAGRNSFVDGGLFLVRLDARSGKLLSCERISHRDPETGEEPQNTVRGVSMPGALPDVLSRDGQSIFMRHMRFDLDGKPQAEDVDHLFSPAGFLDDEWWHRTYWQVGTTMGTGYGGWPTVGNQRISGRLLVVDGRRVFGFGRKAYSVTGSHVGLEADYHLFAADRELVRPEPPEAAKGKKRRRGPGTKVSYLWSESLPLYARAMILAGDTLFVAGPAEIDDLTAVRPRGEVSLWAVSAKDGSKVAEYALGAAPVFDSLAAAGGRLYLATVDGRVVCYEAD